MSFRVAIYSGNVIDGLKVATVRHFAARKPALAFIKEQVKTHHCARLTNLATGAFEVFDHAPPPPKKSLAQRRDARSV